MTDDPTQLALLIAGLAFGVLGIVALVAGLAALVRLKPMRFMWRTVFGLLLVGVGTLALAVAFGSQGYRALTQEQLAGRIAVHPTGPQRFEARFVFPDGRTETYAIAGDELYVDAHILKWKPIANLIGLSTAYELDRIGGRYRTIEQERGAERTVHPLTPPSRPVDLFELRRRYAFLAPLFDAEYGSASFVPVDGDAELQLLVSPTGLLIRPRS